MADFSKIHSHVILNGKGNYSTWAFTVRNHLQAANLVKHIEGDLLSVEDKDKVYTPFRSICSVEVRPWKKLFKRRPTMLVPRRPIAIRSIMDSRLNNHGLSFSCKINHCKEPLELEVYDVLRAMNGHSMLYAWIIKMEIEQPKMRNQNIIIPKCYGYTSYQLLITQSLQRNSYSLQPLARNPPIGSPYAANTGDIEKVRRTVYNEISEQYLLLTRNTSSPKAFVNVHPLYQVLSW